MPYPVKRKSAAVGQVAHQFNTPYVVVRAMCLDVGDENAGSALMTL